MAKAIVFNATPYKVIFEGEWDISERVNDKSRKEISRFGNNWIDNLWYELKFSVQTDDKSFIYENNRCVPPTDTRAYLIYCDDDMGVCCSQLNCSRHYSQFKIHEYYKKALNKLVNRLITQIDHEVGDVRELKTQLSLARKALDETTMANEFIDDLITAIFHDCNY